jgi:hypothetical protein
MAAMILDVVDVAITPDHRVGDRRVASSRRFKLFSDISQRLPRQALQGDVLRLQSRNLSGLCPPGP